MNTGIDAILSQYEEAVQTLGWEVRDFLLLNLKGIEETPDAAAKIIGYGYGPGYKNMICTIIPSKKGIKLGFYKGSELPDPENLLTGTGKVHRHVVIDSPKDLKKGALKELVKAAHKAWEKRKG